MKNNRLLIRLAGGMLAAALLLTACGKAEENLKRATAGKEISKSFPSAGGGFPIWCAET